MPNTKLDNSLKMTYRTRGYRIMLSKPNGNKFNVVMERYWTFFAKLKPETQNMRACIAG